MIVDEIQYLLFIKHFQIVEIEACLTQHINICSKPPVLKLIPLETTLVKSGTKQIYSQLGSDQQ